MCSAVMVLNPHASHASGIGWGMTLIRVMISVYYNVILSWSLFYIGSSFFSPLPWSHCLHLENGGGEITMDILFVVLQSHIVQD